MCKDFEKKDEYPSLIISEIMDCEMVTCLKGLASEDHAVIKNILKKKMMYRATSSNAIILKTKLFSLKCAWNLIEVS